MYGSGMMTFTGQRNNTPPRKTVGFPNPCDNFFKHPLQAGCVCSERCSWFDGCTFAKKVWIFLKFLVDIVTRIRRRREPPFQSLPCRTGRTARFDFATQNLSGSVRSIPAPIQENRWVFRRPVTMKITKGFGRRRNPPIQSLTCRTGHRPGLFAANAVHVLVRGDDVYRSGAMTCLGREQ